MEGQLSRQLDIRFIDARELVNEAKLALGITGYASKDQQPLVMQHAQSMFESFPKMEQEKMHQMNGNLMIYKTIQHSQSSCSSSVSTTMMHGLEDSTAATDHDHYSVASSHGTRKSSGGRSRKGWFLRRPFSMDP